MSILTSADLPLTKIYAIIYRNGEVFSTNGDKAIVF
jgi:hypothetical protein